jgi:low temperature requirement protein LtrA
VSEIGAEPNGERRTSPVEPLWDLVFVFAITQVTTLLAGRPGWGRFGEAMLVLALVWWAWSAFVWAANAQAEGSETLRAYLLAAMVRRPERSRGPRSARSAGHGRNGGGVLVDLSD